MPQKPRARPVLCEPGARARHSRRSRRSCAKDCTRPPAWRVDLRAQRSRAVRIEAASAADRTVARRTALLPARHPAKSAARPASPPPVVGSKRGVQLCQVPADGIEALQRDRPRVVQQVASMSSAAHGHLVRWERVHCAAGARQRKDIPTRTGRGSREPRWHELQHRTAEHRLGEAALSSATARQQTGAGTLLP